MYEKGDGGMSGWQDAYRDLDLMGGRITFLLEDGEDMIDIRYEDGMVIDAGYLEHWRCYCVTVLAGDTLQDWQKPIEEATVEQRADLAAVLQEMIRKYRGK